MALWAKPAAQIHLRLDAQVRRALAVEHRLRYAPNVAIDVADHAVLAEARTRIPLQLHAFFAHRRHGQLKPLRRPRLAALPLCDRLGRIRLSKEQQADKVETVKKMLAEKKPFQDVADAVGIPEHGFWRAVAGTGGKMNVADMTDDLQKVVGKLGVGDVSEPLEQRTSISWFSVIGTEVPRSISIFDPDLQLNLRGELRGTQERVEQAGIANIDLVRAYLAFADVLVPRRELPHHHRRAEFVEVAADRGIRNTE